MRNQHRFGLRWVTFGALLSVAIAGPAIPAKELQQPGQQAHVSSSGDSSVRVADLHKLRLGVRTLRLWLGRIRRQALEGDTAGL